MDEWTDKELREWAEGIRKNSEKYLALLVERGLISPDVLRKVRSKSAQKSAEGWIEAQEVIRRLKEDRTFRLEAREANIRQKAARLGVGSLDSVQNDLSTWLEGHRPGWEDQTLSDKTLDAWEVVIRKGSSDPNFEYVLKTLNDTGYFPSMYIDKNFPEDVIQKRGLETIARLRAPKARQRALQNLTQGIAS